MEIGATKTILSMRIARELLARGHQVVDIRYSRDKPGTSVYVFENNPELERYMTESKR